MGRAGVSMHGKPEDGSGKVGPVDPEAFARNLARLVEEGSRALSAYLKPREEGQITNELAEQMTDAVKSLGQVAEYWLADPQRSLEAQSSLMKAYLDVWSASAKRLSGVPTEPAAVPDPKDKRF